MPKYYIINFVDWVQIVPVTKEGQMILVEQYRNAAQRSFLEVPGGSTDDADQGNNGKAALRELTEETGYTPGRVISAGSFYPNPALQTNRMHTFVGFDCELKAKQQLDPFEELEVVLRPVKEVYKLLDEGKLNHCLAVASLAYARPHLKEFL